MQLEVLEKLEKKIGQALGRIDRLREENKQMSSSYNTMSIEVEEVKKISAKLEEENRRLKDKLSKSDQGKNQKELRIKKRIERLVEKLNLLESMA